MQKKIPLSIVVTLAILFGCRPIKPTGPNLPIEPIVVQPLPPSNIDVPITLDLSTTFAKLNADVPSEMYSDNWPNMQGSGNCRVEYKWFFSRTPMAISLSGQTINISSTGSYGAEASVRPCCGWLCPWISVSCGTKNLKELAPQLLKHGFKKATLDSLDKYLGENDEIVRTNNDKFNKDILFPNIKREPPRQIILALSSNVSLENNYQLKTATTLTRFEPVNRCTITFLSIDITDRILEKVKPRITDALAAFDLKMGQNNFRSYIEPIWNKLFEPIPIASNGFLTLNPEQVRLSTLNGSDNKFNFSIGLTAQPNFTFADPGPQPIKPLPDISSNVPGNGYNLYVDGKLEYAPLTSQLNQALTNIGNIPIDKGGYLSLSNAEIFGIGNSKLLIKLNLKGKVKGVKYKGWLYLSGTPTYNATTGELTLENLDYTFETRNILLRVANWLLNSRIKEILQEKTRWNVSSTIENIKKEVNASINRELNSSTRLEGNVDNLNIVGLQALKEYLLLRVNTNGQISVKIQ